MAFPGRTCSPDWCRLVSCEVDGELDDLDAVRLKRHLARCPTCAAWAEEASALARLLRSTEPAEPDRMLAPQVLRRRRTRAALLTTSAASVAAAVVAGLALQLPTGTGPSGRGRSQTRPLGSAASCRWCGAARFVELSAPTGSGDRLAQARVLLNPVPNA